MEIGKFNLIKTGAAPACEVLHGTWRGAAPVFQNVGTAQVRSRVRLTHSISKT